jgi:hypothetical protein
MFLFIMGCIGIAVLGFAFGAFFHLIVFIFVELPRIAIERIYAPSQAKTDSAANRRTLVERLGLRLSWLR